MALGAAGGGGGGRGRRRARRRPLSEINVTPLVDVMLVLLIIFMVSAPLLNAGVPLQLPETEAPAVETRNEPLMLSIDQDGVIYLDESQVSWDDLLPVMARASGEAGREQPVFVRADGRAPYQAVARVMGRLSAGGYVRINLITDTSARPTAVPAPAAAPEAAGPAGPGA